MGKHTESIHIEIDNEEFEVECVVYEDPGCRTMRNGDPGWPPSFEVEVNEITDWDGKSVLDRMQADEDFCEKVYELVYDKAGQE